MFRCSAATGSAVTSTSKQVAQRLTILSTLLYDDAEEDALRNDLPTVSAQNLARRSTFCATKLRTHAVRNRNQSSLVRGFEGDPQERCDFTLEGEVIRSQARSQPAVS